VMKNEDNVCAVHVLEGMPKEVVVAVKLESYRVVAKLKTRSSVINEDMMELNMVSMMIDRREFVDDFSK
jgi:hypothetical protein